MPKIPADAHYIPEQQPDPRPGFYYASATDHGHYWLLAGPYTKHQDALDAVPQAREISIEHDRRAFWFAYGTCRLEEDGGPGILNKNKLM